MLDLSLPPVSLGLSLPSASLGLSLPSASLGLSLPSVSLDLSLPSVSLDLSLPSVSLGLSLPSVSLGLSLPCTSPASLCCGLSEYGLVFCSRMAVQGKGLPPSVVPKEGSSPASFEYICGGFSSVVNVAVTFPLNKVMFRQQIHGIRLHHAVHQMYKEGFLYLYRGLLPPLMQRTATVSLMFGTYAQYYGVLKDRCPYLMAHTIAAISAGTTEAILVPLERVQAVMQSKTFHGELKNTGHAFRTISQLGIKELYRGLSAVLLRNGPSNALFLGLRQPLKEALPHSDTMIGQSTSAFLSGAGLGAALSTAFFPLNVVKNRMQVRIGGPFLSVREAFHETLMARDYSWRKLFRGVHINYTRSFLSWGIVNTVYDFLHRYLTSRLDDS